MPHFFASKLRAVAFPAQSANFKFIFEAKSLRDKSAIIFAESTHSRQKILLSKQEKDGKFLVKFNKHFASHSKEIIKSALKEYADLVGAEITSHNLNENKIKVDLAYLLGWHEICALLGGNSPLDLHSADFANLGHCADFSLALRPKFAKNHESQTENPSVVDSAHNAQNLGENSEKNAESALDSANQNNPSLRANPQDLRGNPPCDSVLFSSGGWLLRNARKSFGLPRSHSLARNDEFLDSSPTAQNDKNSTRIAESALDSAESQNLIKNNSVRSTQNSPASWCKKSESKGAEVPPADFLLEAEKRGTPPKSEKAAAFWRVGGAGRGVQPFLREETSEISGNGNAESSTDSMDSAIFLQGGLPRRFCESARNDEILDSSLRLRSAHNDNLRKNTESSQTTPQDAEFAMLEIGFGSGRHILHLAQTHPTARIIGLEIYRPAISQVLRQIELLNLQNLYLASIDARVLFEVLPEKCLDRIFLHFPVPWDKNPQRRVLSEQFLSNAMRALKDDGIFELLTDSAEYFSFAKALAKDYKCVAEEGADSEVVSKYEARWRKQNKVIYKLCVANSASCGDFSHLRKARFLDEPYVLSASLASHKCENSSTILEFASCVEVDSTLDSANQTQNAKSTLDSANSQNLGENISSLRADSQNLRGKPPCNFNNYRLPRSHLLARNDELFRDSSLRLRSAQNDKVDGCFAMLANPSDCHADSANLLAMTENNDFAESSLVSASFTPTKICKKEYFLHIKNKYIFSGGVVVFASFGAYYAPSSAYFVLCGDEVSTISEIIPTRANIDAVGLFMELCFDN